MMQTIPFRLMLPDCKSYLQNQMDCFTLIQPKYVQFSSISTIVKIHLSSHVIIQKGPQRRIKKGRHMLSRLFLEIQADNYLYLHH